MKQTFDFTEIQSCNQITYLSEERIKSTAVPNVASLKSEYLKPFFFLFRKRTFFNVSYVLQSLSNLTVSVAMLVILENVFV
jgi:hypothetical protein